MKIRTILLVLILAGCSTVPCKTGSALVSTENLGKNITLEGWAVDRKNGAQLLGDGFDVWIDGLSSWPDGYDAVREKGKRVRVSGVLTEDKGLPVSGPRGNNPVVQGIPVPEGTDLEKARLRYILKDAKWELLPQ